uniref:NADH dehydrogenase subunit 2 n=1 Tax=Anaplecta omei TaxID=2093429 RepID=UPI0022FDAAB5|nr:NADH dehydrogenase subunit 2 [Anaplecta omei]WAX39194.1 NADH dehydrogenase subunit 2 [Anaplecta omei]
MKFNSTKTLLSFTLISGILISVSSNSWLGVWLGLEVNLLSFIPIMSSSEDIMTTEASMKYFIVQAMASSILIFMITMTTIMKPLTLSNPFTEMPLNMPLLIKLGGAPFHWWFPSVMEGLQWDNCFILLTIQKIAPLTIISYTMTLTLISNMVIVTSIIVGSMGGYNQTSLRKILTYSSINHLGWLIPATIISKPMFLVYLAIYSLMNWIITSLMKSMHASNINQINSPSRESSLKKMLMMSALLSLGGLPPFIGFMPKWLVILSMVNSSSYTMITLMVLTSLITLYYYLRLIYTSMMLQDTKTKWYTNNPLTGQVKIMTSLTILSLTGMLIMIPLMNLNY